MAGRYSGDRNSDVDYSLLAPRPFRSSQQYQSMTSSRSSGSGATSPTKIDNLGSPSRPSYTSYENEPLNIRAQLDRNNRASYLSPEEPAEWGFIGTDVPGSVSPRDTGRVSVGKERVIPIKLTSVPSGGLAGRGPAHFDSKSPLANETSFVSSISNGEPFLAESIFNQPPPTDLGLGRVSRDWPSVTEDSRNVRPSVERVIPIRIEGRPELKSEGSGRRSSLPITEPIRPPVAQQFHQQPPPSTSKTVRFSDWDQYRRISPPSTSPPILSSPVYAAERRAPTREGSVVRNIGPYEESGGIHNVSVIPKSRQPTVEDRFELPKSGYDDFTTMYRVGNFQQNGRESVEPPPLIKMFDAAVLDGPLKEFLTLCANIGGDVDAVGTITKDAFNAQRTFLWKADGSPKPSDAELTNLLKPMLEKMEAIQAMKSSKRSSAFFNHLSAIAEGIPALGWSPTPAPYIKEMSDASQFYTNRVLKDFKDKDKAHVDWVKAWLQTLSELQQFVKQNHTTGLVWNTTPGAAPSTAGPAIGGPPAPPPPPPPPPPVDLGAKMDSSDADARAALFADINKGLDITRGLKKVTADMQTHKNPALRQQSPASGDQSKPTIPPKPSHLSNGNNAGSPPAAATAAKKPTGAPEPQPVLTCEGGKKWIVEHHKGNKNIVIEIADLRQVVYIYKCTDCFVQIKGKANSITMDSCKKTSIVFENLLSSIEVINCQSAQVQTLGTMPTVVVQKTDGCQIYLSKQSLNAEIVTSKSSEMNVAVPDEAGEYHEYPVPEQYRTVYNGKKLITEVVDIA